MTIEKEYKTIIYFVIPLITLVGHYQFSLFARYEAVLQGYSAYLEKHINDLMQDEVFCWNRKYLDSYIVPKYFLTNRMSSPVFSCFVFLPNIYVFYVLFFTCILAEDNKIFLFVCSSLLLIVYISISAVLVYDCAINEKVRKNAAEGKIVGNDSKKKKLKLTILLNEMES